MTSLPAAISALLTVMSAAAAVVAETTISAADPATRFNEKSWVSIRFLPSGEHEFRARARRDPAHGPHGIAIKLIEEGQMGALSLPQEALAIEVRAAEPQQSGSASPC